MQTTNPILNDQDAPKDISPRFWEVGEYGLVLTDLLDFLKIALSTGLVPFEIHRAGMSASPASSTVHGSQSLDYYFHQMREFMSIVMPGYAYSPLLDLFRTCFQKYPLLHCCSFRDPSARLLTAPMLEAEVFNDFIQMLRTHARQQGTWLQVRKWKSDTERSQAEAIAEYVPKLLRSGGRLEPIRVDVQYQQNVATLADAMPYGQWVAANGDQLAYVPMRANWPSDNPESRARIDPNLAMQDRARFFANVYRDADRQTFQYMRGYISKMERRDNGANHFHFCFFFDANRPAHVTTDAVIDVSSRRWLRATHGRGLVFSCHTPEYRQALRRQGRWVLDPLAEHNGRQVRRLTDYLVGYFARDKDQSMHVKPTTRSRALTMAVGREVGAPFV